MNQEDLRRAARIAEQAKDFRRAAELYRRAGDMRRAAEMWVAGKEPLLAAELYEQGGEFERAGRIYLEHKDYARAAPLFEQLGDKRRAADLLVRAVSLEGAGRLIGPEAREAIRRAAVLYAEIGRLEFALRVLRWGGQLVFAGQLLARAGRHREAADILLEAGDLLGAAKMAKEGGDEVRAHQILAERAQKEGRLPEAAAHYEQAGSFAEAARLYELGGELALAALSYERARSHDLAAPLYERAGDAVSASRCLRAAGREAEARVLEERAAQKSGGLHEQLAAGDFVGAGLAILTRARAGERSRYAEAIAVFERVSRTHRDYVTSRALVAEIVAELGDGRRALGLFQQLFAGLQPEVRHVPALYRYARLLEREGFLAAARSAYQTALALDPSYADLRVCLKRLREVDLGGFDSSAGARSGTTPPPSLGAPLAEPGPEPPPVSADTRDLFQASVGATADLPGEASEESIEDLDDSQIVSTFDDAAPRPDDLLGTVLRGRFRIESKLGSGAQAHVYLARDQVLDREVAIKVLLGELTRDKTALDRFLREARLAARVQHPQCVAIFDFGQEHGLTFMAMEYFKGRTLRELIKKGPMDAYLALRIARDVAAALGAVHEAGIIHRDVKPSNVMVDAAGNVRLADFGVARTLGDETSTGMMVGTIRYMPPEQARGRETDRRSDIFSLGVVVFEMLAGEPPFGGTIDALIARVHRPPPELPESLAASPLVREIVKKCMQKDPKGRYESTALLIEALSEAIAVLKRPVS